MLLTDGNNEPGRPSAARPRAGGDPGRDLGVTLHTIAVGRAGGIVRGDRPRHRPARHRRGRGPDLPLLERLAEITGGRPFVATDADAMEDVFQAIDELEKSPVKGEIRTRYDERFAPWAAAAAALLAIDRLLVAGPLRRLP